MLEKKMTYPERKEAEFVSMQIDTGYSSWTMAERNIEKQAEAIRKALYDLLYTPFGASEEEFKRHIDSWLLEHGYKPSHI